MKTSNHTSHNLRKSKLRTASILTLVASLGLGAVMAVPLAHAQDAEVDSSASGATVAKDEIIVTARRREERLLDVPISITALDAQALAQSGVLRLRDIDQLVPNLIATGPSTNGRPDLVIRGIQGSSGQPGADLSLATYVNGVYMGRDTSANPELFDIAQIEVLRGPQGTLYGRNSISGAVNIVTAKPGNEFAAKATVDVGNFNLRRFSGGVNIPLAEDKAALKLNAFSIDRDGYNINIANDTRPDEENSYGGMIHLRLTPTDNLEVNLTADASWEDRNILFSEVVSPGSFGFVPGVRTVNFDADQREDREVSGLGLVVDYTLSSGHIITSVTGARKSSNFVPGDTDDGPLDLGRAIFLDTARQFSQELRLTSPSGGKVDYVAGLFYFRGVNKADRDIVASDFLISLFTGAPPGFFPPQSVNNTAKLTSSSYAAFANVNWHISEDLTVILGGRITQDSKKTNQSQLGTFPLNAILGTPDVALIDEIKETNFSPLIGLSYSVNDNVTTYGQFSRGFRSGSFSTDLVPSINDLSADSEFINNFEIGAKGSFYDRKLNINAALFVMKYRDIQVGQRPAGAIFSQFTNAGRATSKGGEIEVQLLTVDGLELRGGIGYADAKYDEFNDCAGPGVSCAGNRLSRSPELTANASAQYTHPLTSKFDLVVRGEYVHRGDMFFNAVNDPAVSVPSINILNGRVGIVSDRFDVFLWAKNLNDELILNGRTANFFGDLTETYGAPKTYGVTFSGRY